MTTMVTVLIVVAYLIADLVWTNNTAKKVVRHRNQLAYLEFVVELQRKRLDDLSDLLSQQGKDRGSSDPEA